MEKRKLFCLEQKFIYPILQFIYEYDSTYSEIFTNNILKNFAEVYKLNDDSNTYNVFLYGIYQKKYDYYVIIRINMKKTNFDFEIESFYPHSMCLLYIHSYSEWKEKKKEILKKSQHCLYLTESQYLNIYNFSFDFHKMNHDILY
jgi:hypothetical protein